MMQISAELLAISSDAAVLVKNDKLVFANGGAMALLGRDCIGKTVAELFGKEIAAVQAGSFIGEFPIFGKRHIIRERTVDGIRAISLSRSEADPSLINDALIYALRNCLMSIDVSLNLLRAMAEQQPELEGSLAVINHDSCRINRILTNLGLVFSLMQEDMPLSPVEMELCSFVRDILDSVMIFSDLPHIKFNAPEEIKIIADPKIIETLVLNLLSNCLIHAHGCKHISISLEKLKESCMICVDDDGCGIAPENLHQVFDRYKHGFNMNQINQGPGLGMSVVRSIAACHGGTLLLESRPGIGTAVRVSLGYRPIKDGINQEFTEPYQPTMDSLLTGLAHWLPSKYYTEKYID